MKKIMLFAYDGTGLGHLMRLIKIASGLSKFADILIVSGHKAMPDIIPVNLKYFMLPNFYELREERHLTNEQVNNRRIKIIDEVFNRYNPDVFITDYLPLGKRCELFHVITKSKCLKYFILRSEIGGKELTHEDVFSVRNIYFLEKYYDRILYASNPAISPISYFNWLPEKIKELISYVGFVTYHVTEQEIKDIRKKYLNSEEKKWIVCSDGGGKISGRFISKCLELPFVDQLSTYQFDIILGNYSTLNWPYGNEVFHTYNNVRIHKWVKDLYKLHASADCVVCSGGYNTLLESIEGKKKIIFSYSVMDSKEEDEQEKNIHNFSKYYPISEIKSLDELIEKVVDGLKKSDKCPLKTNIKFEGIKNISLIINKRRLIF